MVLKLTIEGGGKLDFQVRKLLNAGYTARDQSEVQKHIEELRKEGIPAPKSIPTLYPKIADRITTSDKIEVLADNTTSGEVEFVLLFDRDNIYVGVGSDHTDRKLEQHNILAAKQMCVNVISIEVWRYEEVTDHWNDLILRSWVEKEGQRELYQEARLETYMKVEDLINMVKGKVTGDLNGMAFYGGTIPVLSGEICFSRRFEAELVDEQMGRSLSLAYSVGLITWFNGEMQIG